ncbi:MAG: sugar phosphate nucleotidyltransferase [Nitrososphaeria archaeon]|nr:sugar phosphate nucleotidyltransferase [Nitrososphaeria archaeon]
MTILSKNVVGGILCGGMGKRLRPITDSIPKSLIEIKENYTILDRQLFQMKYSGISKVYLLAGYLYEKIRERYGTYWKGVEIEYYVEDRPRGTLFAINNLLKMSDSKYYLVMNGDIVTDLNLKLLINQSLENAVTIAVTKLVSPYGIVELANGKIIGFKEKPTLPYYINAGIYFIDARFKEYFFAYEEGDVEKTVFPYLAKKGLLNYYMEEDTFWQSIDSQKDLEFVRKEFVNRIDKPWGYEKIIAETENYLTVQYYIMKDSFLPMHHHEKRDETLHILSGEGYLYIENEKIKLSKDDVIRVFPKKKHKIIALETLKILSYSTPYPDDYIEDE